MDIPPEVLKDLLDQYYADYADNKSQVLDRINKSNDIAKQENSLYRGTVIDTKTFEELYNELIANYNTWDTCYDVATGSGDYTVFTAAGGISGKPKVDLSMGDADWRAYLSDANTLCIGPKLGLRVIFR